MSSKAGGSGRRRQRGGYQKRKAEAQNGGRAGGNGGEQRGEDREREGGQREGGAGAHHAKDQERGTCDGGIRAARARGKIRVISGWQRRAAAEASSGRGGQCGRQRRATAERGYQKRKAEAQNGGRAGGNGGEQRGEDRERERGRREGGAGARHANDQECDTCEGGIRAARGRGKVRVMGPGPIDGPSRSGRWRPAATGSARRRVALRTSGSGEFSGGITGEYAPAAFSIPTACTVLMRSVHLNPTSTCISTVRLQYGCLIGMWCLETMSGEQLFTIESATGIKCPEPSLQSIMTGQQLESISSFKDMNMVDNLIGC
ncbi:hypothetical protein DFH09DRAFT_1087277 [Mycena vulgaris]|nr:hypothetical protein DFH09DRAFT_1087277 [Mycena vulgaris]